MFSQYFVHEVAKCADLCPESRLGYNHATECRPITMADVDKVKAKMSSKYVREAAMVHAKL